MNMNLDTRRETPLVPFQIANNVAVKHPPKVFPCLHSSASTAKDVGWDCERSSTLGSSSLGLLRLLPLVSVFLATPAFRVPCCKSSMCDANCSSSSLFALFANESNRRPLSCGMRDWWSVSSYVFLVRKSQTLSPNALLGTGHSSKRTYVPV
jgi:hypothetical protein